jgi:3-deoxy-D-manno-octulosonate 8-phosphate phosphatase KdsC-like HAD superfamily phosphatase
MVTTELAIKSSMKRFKVKKTQTILTTMMMEVTTQITTMREEMKIKKRKKTIWMKKSIQIKMKLKPMNELISI